MEQSPEPVFDMQVAAERLGDLALVKMLASTYLENVPQFLADIRAAVAARDIRGLERTSHMLASSLAYLAASAASDAALTVERLCKDRKLDAAIDAHGNLEGEIARLNSVIATVLSEEDPPRKS